MTTDQDVKLNITLSPDAAGKPLQVTITSPWDGAELWSGQLEDAGTFYSDTTIVRSISGLEPRLWSPSDPALYDLKLVCGDYSSTVKVGFRRFEMKDGVMCLNGQRIVFKGVNRHDFCAETGRAVPPEKILAFFRSPIGREMTESGNLHREMKFSELQSQHLYPISAR